jgi:hypothetical protein
MKRQPKRTVVAAAWCAAPIRSGLRFNPEKMNKRGIFLEFPLKSAVGLS